MQLQSTPIETNGRAALLERRGLKSLPWSRFDLHLHSFSPMSRLWGFIIPSDAVVVDDVDCAKRRHDDHFGQAIDPDLGSDADK